MNYPILSTRITESTIVALRDRARQVGEIFGLDKLESTRFITAVSEIGRNAVQYAGGGTAAFSFKGPNDPNLPQSIIAVVSDSGPGMSEGVETAPGQRNARGRIPLGIAGARRMVDVLTIQSPVAGGTIITLEIFLPRTMKRLTAPELNERTRELIARKPKTPLQELEKQNSEMLDALQELREKQMELTRADERKNEFLSMLAHELRNPLGTLILNLELLRLHPHSLSRCWDAMSRQAQQMGKLIDDLMDFSRISQGKVKLDKVPLEVNQLVGHALEMSAAALVAKKHVVTLHRHGSEIWIAGDNTRLTQVICNLLQNAARYTPPQGHIDISITIDATSVYIEIADDGIGISHEMIQLIFEMFVQGDSSSKASPGGLGIGLTLVRRLLDTHSGSVTASSEGLGKGSKFLVTLPLATS